MRKRFKFKKKSGKFQLKDKGHKYDQSHAIKFQNFINSDETLKKPIGLYRLGEIFLDLF